ncbi:MAG: ribosome assembly cofactor RimP, partial [Candidatus Cloacimonetes bacterium]|nr:ribosome assembly cofactor RimP [Candidatus Cloacimonadota bacterium]
MATTEENQRQQVEVLANKVAEQCRVMVYDVEIKNTQKGKLVLVYLNKINGVKVADCECVSRALSEELDIAD